MSQEITIRDMLSAGLHFGHRRSYWHPGMAPYIYDERGGLHIIDLQQTLPLFKQALNFVSSIAQKNGKILFVGTKPTASDIIREQATRCGMPYVDHRWLGGMLTNYKTIRLSIKRLRDLEHMIEQNVFQGLTKKERLSLMREQEKLQRSLGGIKDMGSLPDALFVVDTGHERIAIEEARRLSIPVIGVVDSNQDPDKVDYVIPGNDDAFRAVEFYVKNAADTILEAKEELAETMAGEAGESEEEQEEQKRRVVTKKLSLKRSVSKQTDEETEQSSETEQASTQAEEQSSADSTESETPVGEQPEQTSSSEKSEETESSSSQTEQTQTKTSTSEQERKESTGASESDESGKTDKSSGESVQQEQGEQAESSNQESGKNQS